MWDGNTRQLQMVQPTRRPAYFSLSSNAPGRHCRSSRSHSYGRPKNPIVSRNYRSLAGFLLTMNRCNRMEVQNLCRSVQTVETSLATLSLYELRVILNNALLRCEGSGRTARCVAYFATHRALGSLPYYSVASFSITTFKCAVTSLCNLTGIVNSPNVRSAS